MSFFAIRKSRFDGVYAFTAKEQAASMQAVAKGCSCRFFNDDEQEAALKWANVSAVSDCTALLSMAAAMPASAPESSAEPNLKASPLSNLLSAALGKKSSGPEVAAVAPAASQEEPIKSVSQSTTPSEPVQNPAICPPSAPKSEPAPVIAPQPPTVESGMRYKCTNPNCGAESEEQARFCIECGSPMAEVVPVVEKPVETPIGRGWVCSAGHANSDEYKFCMECGEKRVEVAAAEVPQPTVETAPGSAVAPIAEDRKSVV